MITRLKREEIEQIITNLERKGEDASALKQALDEVYHNGRQDMNHRELSDDELIEQLKGQSPVEEGEALTCVLCTKPSPKLYSDVCETCFRAWALTTRKGKRK